MAHHGLQPLRRGGTPMMMMMMLMEIPSIELKDESVFSPNTLEQKQNRDLR